VSNLNVFERLLDCQVRLSNYTQRQREAVFKIQRWYRHVRAKRRVSSVDEYSMKEILESKRQKLLRQWNDGAVKIQTDGDKNRQKEEKARQARLDAIEVSKT